jgi:Flp pilus assembly protein TadG
MITMLRSLWRDRRAVTAVEFAIVAPVLCLFLVCAFDIGHTLYMRAALQGIVQKASRDSALETGLDTTQQTAIDNLVTSQVHELQREAVVNIKRRFYRNFTEASAKSPEPFTDTNGNGRCDAGEPYEDKNLNTVWDPDGGDQGAGGAKDAVIYTVTATYDHVLPIWQFIGGSSQAKVSASTVWRNQPYGDQAVYAASTVQNCP